MPADGFGEVAADTRLAGDVLVCVLADRQAERFELCLQLYFVGLGETCILLAIGLPKTGFMKSPIDWDDVIAVEIVSGVGR